MLNQRELSQWSIQDKANVLAVLPQHSQLNFLFTANEVVALGCIPHTTGYAADQKIIADALQMVDASYLERRLYTQMSGIETVSAICGCSIWNPNLLVSNFWCLMSPQRPLIWLINR